MQLTNYGFIIIERIILLIFFNKIMMNNLTNNDALDTISSNVNIHYNTIPNISFCQIQARQDFPGRKPVLLLDTVQWSPSFWGPVKYKSKPVSFITWRPEPRANLLKFRESPARRAAWRMHGALEVLPKLQGVPATTWPIPSAPGGSRGFWPVTPFPTKPDPW